MKTLLSVLLGLCVAALSLAQPAPETTLVKRTPEDLRKLLAPIALYPDALVALILPAATNPEDLVLAARFLVSSPDQKEIENQPWDESVKSLARYPELIKWMDENLEWTKEVGAAFAAQPADLMATVQTLRKEAQTAGLLTDTPQQKVVVREEEVTIVPAQEDVIYVPEYDPEVLIVHRPVYGPWISFGAGFAIGSWLSYDCDWRSHRVVVCNRPAGWTYRPDWRWHDRNRSTQIVFQEWRPRPAYWQHLHNRRFHDYRPVPVVRPPHFAERRFDQRHWDGRRDDRRDDRRNWSQPGNDHGQGQRDFAGRRNGRADLTGANQPPAVINSQSSETRRENVNLSRDPGQLRGRRENRITPPASSVPAPVGITTPSSNPPQAAGNQNWRQIQERRLTRPVDAGAQRTYPHRVNNPGVQRPAAPAEARVSPPPAPPQRVGNFNQRGGGVPNPGREAWHPAPVARQPAPPPQPAAAAPAPSPRREGGGGANPGSQPGSGREGGRDMHRVFQ